MIEIKKRRKFLKESGAVLAGFMIVPRFVLGGTKMDGTKYLAPSDKINLGLIGGGKQGRILSSSFLKTKEIRFAALSEVYQDKVKVTIDHIKGLYEKNPDYGTYEEIKIMNDYRQMLEDKSIDAVIIATPDHQHAVMTINAAKSGKDIFVEKPLANTVREGRAMVEAVRLNKRIAQTGSMQRSWKEFRQAANIIRNGYLGNIKSVKVNVGLPPKKFDLPGLEIPKGLDWKAWLGPNSYSPFHTELAPPITNDIYPAWRDYMEFCNGRFADWGAHMFDIVQWSLNMDHSGPTKIHYPDGKDFQNLTFEYTNGVTMAHEKWEWENAIHFIGDEGEMKLKRGQIECSNPLILTKDMSQSEKNVIESVNHYSDFLNSMRTRNNPIADVEIGHRTSTICSLGVIAYNLKKSLVWDPTKETIVNNKKAKKMLTRKLNKEYGVKI
ncbi:MAG: Gfo/Idh/MocA family oxidoreductase [Saprospiraceae bacterium]|jgi:predicted dehydrogenase|nr:Gfo/Idh/MocA family oxidoreductase [Saprospiraceae bacterium]